MVHKTLFIGVTGASKGWEGVSGVYRGLQGVTKNYKGSQGVTSGDKGLRELHGVQRDDRVTKDYWG